MLTKEYALIVAGGKGTRIKSNVPKQFIELNGKPILLHTVEAFYRYSSRLTLVLVLPEDDVEIWNGICKKFNFTGRVILQKGGATRFEWVRNGVYRIEGEGMWSI